jgi:hypothetical protein
MPTPEEEQLNANIELLLAVHYEGMNPVARQNLMDSMQDIRDEYKQAVELGKSSKYYKDVSESIAKSLPALVKGTYSAVKAFESGDYISGSAAIMDMCASLIPVFASVASAAGPAGALIGALFSVVGQILSFFAPKQPSLKEQIEKMLDHQQSETQIIALGAFAHSVSSYTHSLRLRSRGKHEMGKPVALAGKVALTAESKTVTGTGTTFTKTSEPGEWLTFDSDTSGRLYKIDEIASDTSLTLTTPYNGAPAAASALKQLTRTIKKRSVDEILAMPLKTEDDADTFVQLVKALESGLRDEKGKLNTPVFAGWQASAYLERKENQKKEGWPEVLGVWCQTYTDLLSANMMLSCLADPKTLARRIRETQVTNDQSPLVEAVRTKCHSALNKLKGTLDDLRDSWEGDYKEMLKVANKITPVARERGLYAHLGYLRGGVVLHVVPGTGKSELLNWDYKSNTAWLKSFSIHLPKSQHDSFTPKYELLACEGDGSTNRIGRHTLDSITGHLSDGAPVIDPRYNGGERFFDVSAMPINEGHIGIDFSSHPVTLVSLAIEDNGPNQYVNVYTLDKDNKSTRVNWQPGIAGTRDIRDLYLPPTTLPDDPDAGALADSNANPPGPVFLSGKTNVIYGGVRNANHLWVLAWNAWATVEGPQNWSGYNGIEVDPYYVWLFGKGGIACATHASMIKCKQGKIKAPSWIYHDFDKQFKEPEVRSLYPCADGSLLVAMQDRIYTADYKIDRSKGRVLTSSWVERGGNAKQVIKMPIPCWSLLESLKANLQSD